MINPGDLHRRFVDEKHGTEVIYDIDLITSQDWAGIMAAIEIQRHERMRAAGVDPTPSPKWLAFQIESVEKGWPLP